MKRRAASIGIFLALAAAWVLGIQHSDASQDTTTRRFRIEERKTFQYVWDLVSWEDGRVICQVTVEHANRPTNQETLAFCSQEIFPQPPTATPFVTRSPEQTLTPLALPTPGPAATSEPFDLTEFFHTVTWRFAETREIVQTVQIPLPDMVVNMVLPSEKVDGFFASIYAYEPLPDEHIVSIEGVLNGWSFTCPSARCDIPIRGSAILEFWAVSSYGDESAHSMATFTRTRTAEGERIELTSLVPVALFQDSCAAIWGVPRYNVPDWADFPALPDDLNTRKPYHYLAGQLIAFGVVDASSCDYNGLYVDGSPSACGYEKATGAVVEWQNQLDLTVWQTSREIGIPARLLKALIERESQFWPGNGRRAALEYGLGQLSVVGADVVLRWDNDLFRSVCDGLLYDCSLPYGRLPSWSQAALRGGLIRMLDAQCLDCENGIDLNRARDSIPIFARALRANCRQVQYLMDRYGLEPSYEDLWKITLVSYHSGYECLASSLSYLSVNRLPGTWDNISSFLGCPSGRIYVNDVWKSLAEFDTYRIERPDRARPIAAPTFAPTPGPTLTPTVFRSMARVRVLVYADANHDNYPDAAERLDDVLVAVQLPDQSVLSAQTVSGEAVFDLTGLPVDSEIVIALPDIYRTQRLRVLPDGELPVTFRLEAPITPPGLP